MPHAINQRPLTALDGIKLRPKSKPYTVWDAKEPGLVLRVWPSGHRSYAFVYRHGHRSRWYTIAPADQIALSEVRAEAAELRRRVRHGEDPAKRVGSRTTANSTFAVLATRYVEEYAKRKNRSWQQAANIAKRHALPVWGDRDANSITRADVRAVFNTMKGPVQANQFLASGSAIYTWGVNQEIVAQNPFRGIERHPMKPRERVLSDAEVPLFWKAFGEAGIPGVALKVLLLTGQRPGEVAHMRWEHIAEGWWTLPGAPDPVTGWPGTKNSATHRIWLPAKVRELLAELGSETSGFVFDQVFPLDAVMRDICKRLSVPRATPHDLRRTFSTTVTSLGFGRDALNRVTNHKEGGIASVYDRYQYSDENRRIMEATSAKLVALAEGRALDANVVALR